MARIAKKKEAVKETAVVTRAEKKDATKKLIREILSEKPLRHNELIDEVSKAYTEHYGEESDNVNDVKGRVGSVLDIMKKEGDVTFEGRYTLTGAYLHESFFSLRYDIVRFYAACAIAEICLTILYENEEYEGLFIGLIESLKSLALSEDDPVEAVASFALIALRESGYPIDLGYLEECEGDIGDKLWFDFADGKFTNFERCTQGERASLSTYHLLRKCAGLTYVEEIAQKGRKRALRLLKAYLCGKTEAKLENLGELIRLIED